MVETLPKQRRSRETRAKLIDAAVAEFAARGFAGASTRSIASRAGVALSAMPYHFKTKETLWRAAAGQIFGRVRAHLEAKADALSELDAYTRARVLLAEFVRFGAAYPELHRFMHQEGAAPSARVEWLYKNHVEPTLAYFRSTLEEMESEGWAPPVRETGHLLYMLIGAATAPYMLSQEFELATGRDPFDAKAVDDHANAIVSLFLPPKP